MRGYDSWKLTTPPEHDNVVECSQCGDRHTPARCEWADTCAECARTDVDMADVRLCVDCADALDRAAKRDRADAIHEGRGDYLRDMQKGAV